MQIGEVAHQVGLATSAIRFYEDKGLIPEAERTEAGYRNYDQSVVDRIRFIRAGQAVGLTLRELNQVLQIRDRGEAPCRHVTDLLDTRIRDFDERIGELRNLRRGLIALRLNGEDIDDSACPPQSVCRIINITG